MQAEGCKQTMLTKRRQKLAVIHIAKKRLGITDKNYRALLHEAAGVQSAADLRNDTQYFTLMRAFRAASCKSRRKHPAKDEGLHCTKAQHYYIRGLWELASRSKAERSLQAMIKRICGIDDPRFLTRAGATKIILALRSIAEKAGFNPDRKD